MLKKVALGLGAAIAVMLAVMPVANAHSPQKVRHMLQDRGFYNIHFTDRTLPIYQATACRRGRRLHLHVNYYGEITRRERIGRCGNRGNLRRSGDFRDFRDFRRQRRQFDRNVRYRDYRRFR